ncbi:RDD family protein [Pseudogracilibacillus auburnensis]|uniref:Putative RDD family membrane protein YckC n=1 Tax=Pseudogracilibacillus auburnensis TaxID=1494959 RepID=A0A2V3VMR1_9BACI|nr:RDD family protein [Pseudogracilibacillus auburnensis]MBO1001431.1 RDD family protein [Pseudogracilibacillus auburnensis]PXW82474.1 putative RDD family membrane protein YckC [Pseudogracilibacillus auburnensis]
MDSYNENEIEETEIKQNQLTTSPNVEYKYAGFWMRFWAYLIDVIIVFSLNGLLLSPLAFINNGYPIELSLWTVNGILGAIVYYIYFLLMTKYFGQTIGKMILGIRVISESSDSLSWNDLVFREVVGRFIYNIMFILKLLYLVVAFSNEKKGLHDMIGNTRVVHIS